MTEIDYERLYEALDWEPLRQDRAGNDIGHCFDPHGWHKHGDRSGKFIVYREDQKASCFVCGGFTLISMVAMVRKCTDDEADTWLDQFREGHEQSDEGFQRQIQERLTYKYSEKPKTLPLFTEGVIDRFIPFADWPTIAEDWAVERGISPDTVVKYNLHYGRIRRLPPKGVDEDPYTGDAIVIPHYWKGKLVGWQNRWLNEDRPMWLKKYTNTIDFPTESTLFNYDRCVKVAEPVVLAESVTTALFLEDNAVATMATFGAKMTAGKLRVLRQFQQGLILAPDNDEPGRQWALRIRRDVGKYVNIWELPPVVIKGEDDGSDLGSLAPDISLLFSYLNRLGN